MGVMASTIATTAQDAARKTSNWRPDIQGLRALAVLLVLIAHVDVPGFKGGFVGVDIFFVISGFLITQLLLREVEKTGTVSITEFYVRRARRILPAAAVATVAILAYAAFAMPIARLEQTVRDAGWSAVFLSNWAFAAEGTDYFSTDAPSYFQHFWSLAVEEQFYLLWPLVVLLLVPRMTRRAFALTTGALLLVSLAWSLFYTAADSTSAYFNTPARAYELMIGALLACVLVSPLRSRWRHAASVAGLVLIAVSVLGFNDLTPFPGWLALIPTVGTALLLAAGPDTAAGRALSWGPARYIGDISFSLYLWHWPVALAVVATLPFDHPYILRFVLTVGISFALAAATFHFVERPFQAKRVPVFSRDRRTLWLWPISVAVILIVAFATAAYGAHRQAVQQQQAAEYFDEHGFQELASEDPDGVQGDLEEAVQVAESGAPIPPDVDADALRNEQWVDMVDGDCYASGGESTADVCFYGDTEAETTIALIGDSHAAMWLPAFDIIGEDHGFRVALFVKLSCGAYPAVQDAAGHSQEDCDAFREHTRSSVEDLDVDAVVLSARGQLNMEERDGESVDAQWRTAVAEAMTFYQGVADRVVAMGDVPARPEAEPQDCVDAPGATQEDCVVSGESVEKRSNAITESEVLEANAVYVDTEPFVCVVDGDCPLFAGDVPVYGDDSHLNRLWVEYVAPALGRELEEALPVG